jgi:hypothetical protein
VTTADLIDRSGPLKAELLAFSRHPRYDEARGSVLSPQRGADGLATSGGGARAITALDTLLLQHRLGNGRTIVEDFVAAHPGLPDEERKMLLGWLDVVEGIFEAGQRVGDELVLTNLLDELVYRVRSNMGPDTFRSLRPRSFVIARLVPLGDGWLVSGALHPVGRRGRHSVYKAAARLALERPELVLRNPQHLERARELQRVDRERFIRFFGTDLVRVPGAELRDRMGGYYAFSRREVLAELESRQQAPVSDPQRELDLDYPAALTQSVTVAVIYDATEGLTYLGGFAEFEHPFIDPDGLTQDRHLQPVLDYLDDDSVSPLPFRRMAERDVNRTSEVMRRALGRRIFDWQREGEALMCEHKAAFFRRPALPRIVPISERLAPYAGRIT